MVANDDLEGKTTHFTGFYTHTISGQKIPKPPIVMVVPNPQKENIYTFRFSGLHGWLSMSKAVNTIPEQKLPTVKKTNIDADTFISVISGFNCGMKSWIFNLLYSHRNEGKLG